MSNLCSFSYADLLERNAKSYRYAPALIGDFDTITHHELLVRSQKLTSSLRQLGVEKGDRIALLASNGPRVLEMLGAAAMSEVVLILLNTRGSTREVAAIVHDSGAGHVFVDTELEPLIVDLEDSLTCYALTGAPVGRLREIPAVEESQVTVLVDVDAQRPLVGIPTAAVEGRPRIALLSHAALMNQALQLSLCWSLEFTDRHLCILPLFHMAGLTLSVAAQLVGGASVLMAKFDPGVAVDAIEQHRASFFASFAPILDNILDLAEARLPSLASLRIVTGLEPAPVVERLIRVCSQAQFWSGYGQTETGGMVSLAPVSERPGSVGRPLAQVALRIAAEDGAEAPVGVPGEILVRSPGVFSGYLGRPEASARTTRNGWHHTGDIGFVDSDGYLWYQGRASEKALIKSGGENIYPAEVEQALLEHPAVAAVRVIGVPDEKWGEAVRAMCVLHPNVQVLEQELIDFVGTRIARFKRPKEILFVDKLD